MANNRLTHFTWAIAGLLIPGAGHACKGNWRAAIAVQAAAVSIVAVICLSRIVVSSAGLEILAVTLAALHLYSGISAGRQKISPGSQSPRRGLAAGMICASLLIPTGLFVFKDRLLGVNLYYIPSSSMVPALHPGDLILVDTWAYLQKPIRIGDIVTFSPRTFPTTEKQKTMVKRVAQISETGDSYFLLGDNDINSSDSRSFGYIEQQYITGKVVRVIRPGS